MNILEKLTIKNLKLNKKRTIVTIIGIILSTALMVGIGLLFASFQNYMIKETISYDGSYESFYKNANITNLKENKEYTYFYEKGLGFAKVESENQYKPYIYLTGVNFNFLKELTLTEGRLPKNSEEIVVSRHLTTNGKVNYKIGDTIKLTYGDRLVENEIVLANNEYQKGETLTNLKTKEYTIVGSVERTPYEEFSACGYTVFTIDENSQENVNLYISFNNHKNIVKRSIQIAKKINYDENNISYHTSLLALYGESNYHNIMSTMISMMIIMLSLVSIGCIIVIYNSFAISVMERKKEFGLLSSIGATKKQLSKTIFYEATIVGIIGITLGVASAYLGIGSVLAIINKLIKEILQYKLTLVTVPKFVIIPVIFMIIVIILSALIPSRRASKISPIEAIRQNDDIKINKRKIKTNKLITKIFGIEGEIALKNIKRNKKKYRVTTISLFISVVLFISFSSYLNYTINAASDVAMEIPYDIKIVYNGQKNDNNKETQNKINEIINNNDVLKYVSFSKTSIPAINNFEYTKEYLEYYKSYYGEEMYEELISPKFKYINIIILDDNSWNEYKKSLNLTQDKIIIYNNFKGVAYNNGTRKNYNVSTIKKLNNNYLKICDFEEIPYDEKNSTEYEQEITNNYSKYCNKTVNSFYLTDKTYDLLSDLSYDSGDKIIMNEKIYKFLINQELDYKTINMKVKNTTNIDKLAEGLEKENVVYQNLKEEAKQSKNLVLVIKILMYGFISLITLIGVTSVFNTITTSMALRKREFAVLRSIGLTRKGFNKILCFESLFFGLKSLLFGIPVSLAITFIIHLSMSSMIDTSSVIIPWSAILTSSISVFAIVLLTMLYSTNKIKKHSIIEQIREENI